ncbi:hypothetical protein [Actinacidiphila rubida]|uniref:hypothetical protein n=1 Tax=Actinacidiphila rubida TaxID=310780 RepID=UPI0008498252|nr:hypothetical protein [Actinacidiphila rubida]
MAIHTPSTLCESVSPLAVGEDEVAGAAALVVALGAGWSADEDALVLGAFLPWLPLSLLHPLSASATAAAAAAIAVPVSVRPRQRI